MKNIILAFRSLPNLIRHAHHGVPPSPDRLQRLISPSVSMTSAKDDKDKCTRIYSTRTRNTNQVALIDAAAILKMAAGIKSLSENGIIESAREQKADRRHPFERLQSSGVNIAKSFFPFQG